MNDLKLCPFCARVAASSYVGVSDEQKAYYGNEEFGCIECDVWFETKKEWNNRASNWISVEDRLPNNEQNVLFFCILNARLKVMTGEFINVFGGRFSVKPGINYGVGEISHWQPLPEAPK